MSEKKKGNVTSEYEFVKTYEDGTEIVTLVKKDKKPKKLSK